MDYEIDFIRVGEESRNGDAIAFRFGNLAEGAPRAEQTVVVIDGGTLKSGQDLVDFIKTHYGTSRADIVVSSHPDADHASGLTIVMEELEVGELWMHRPWREEEVGQRIDIGRVVDSALKRSLEDASAVEQIAIRKNVPMKHPFSDGIIQHPNLIVLGPSQEYYSELVEQFDESITQYALRVASGVTFAHLLQRVRETWNDETLSEPIEGTSPKNNSSVVLLLHNNSQPIALFTADAGVPALTKAADFADTLGITLANSQFIQVPHHGSRRNVGPTILNRIIGSPLAEGQYKMKAFVSNAKNADEKHPSKRVMNAFHRRGAPVCQTSTNGNICYFSPGTCARQGYGPITHEPLYAEVEE